MTGLLVSVNVGRIEAVGHHDRTVTTGIYKRPVTGRATTRGVNVVGDDQADRSVHGGPDRALYAYAAEDLEWWADQLGAADARWDDGREPDDGRRRRHERA